MTDHSVGASLPGAAPRSPREAEQLARLKARDLDGFSAALLESVRLYADTEAGRQGMGSPVLAEMVYAGIERDIAMLVGAALEAGPSPCQHVNAIERALNELGVPQPGYPQPVANAVEILRASLGWGVHRESLPDWRSAALKCVIPMEALHADNLDGSQLIAPSLRVYIADAVAALREAASLEGVGRVGGEEQGAVSPEGRLGH